MLKVIPIWADSLGAKSFSTLIETQDVTILVDPGIAIMHRSFPAPLELKREWTKRGYEAIVRAAIRADIVIITHYHYDHFIDFDERLYKNKLILAKSPNDYINDSQRKRALSFYSNLFKMARLELDKLLKEPIEREYPDPLQELPLAMSINYGDYKKRKEELIKKGMKWYLNRVKNWNKYERIPEIRTPSFELRFADNKSFQFGNTKIKFTKPLFHGIEFSRVGWVIALTIECCNKKVLYSSDLNGPIIEDYAEWIIKEKPNYLLLDGPATYTLGYILNLINLKRVINNLIRIIKEATPDLVLLDHHLPRERKFKERIKEVLKVAERENIKVLTVAEYYGKKPAVLITENEKKN